MVCVSGIQDESEDEGGISEPNTTLLRATDPTSHTPVCVADATGRPAK